MFSKLIYVFKPTLRFSVKPQKKRGTFPRFSNTGSAKPLTHKTGKPSPYKTRSPTVCILCQCEFCRFVLQKQKFKLLFFNFVDVFYKNTNFVLSTHYFFGFPNFMLNFTTKIKDSQIAFLGLQYCKP